MNMNMNIHIHAYMYIYYIHTHIHTYILTHIHTQVLSLDRKFLDPRRPIGKPTENDIEEMLVPYSPYLPIIPTSVLSYNRTVQQLRGFAVVYINIY